MAIDDNKVYGFTGAQVKELPGKVEAVKGLAKVLTTDDYNWPTNNPTGVALWLLEPGIYEVGGNFSVWDTSISSISSPGASGRGAIAVVGDARTDGGVNTKPIISFAPNGKNAYYAIVNKDTGVKSSRGRFLLSSDVKNDLASTSTTDPLSAAQGKVLKDMIDALPTGGGVTELTTADYNYPTDNPDGVAQWLLDPGHYKCGETINIYYSFNESGDTTWADFWVLKGYDGQTVVASSSSGYIILKSLGANGSTVGAHYENSIVLTASQTIDNLTSTSDYLPLSAAQGKVLNDKIGGDLSNLTTTDKTSLINAINEVAGQSGGGGITKLTSADYNWPTNNPDGVALWLLDSGVYLADGIKAYADTSADGVVTGADRLITIFQDRNDSLAMMLTHYFTITEGVGLRLALTNTTDGSPMFTGGATPQMVLQKKDVVNNLTTTTTTSPLSAAQGKALNDKITPISGTGAPTTAMVGELGKIYIDTSTDTAYMCVKADTITPEYTWRQITS